MPRAVALGKDLICRGPVFAEGRSLPRAPVAGPRQRVSLPSARDLALGKAGFTVKRFDGASLSSVALGKGFAECMGAFAECMGALGKACGCCSDSFRDESNTN